MWGSINARGIGGLMERRGFSRRGIACLVGLSLSLFWVPLTNATGTVDAFTSKDGLINNSIEAIHEQPNGYLWIATRGGLVRFDGAEFEGLDNHPNKPTEPVLHIESDNDGVVWILTEAALYGYDGDRFRLYYRVEDDRIRTHLIRSESEIVLGVGSRIIFLRKDLEAVIHGEREGLPVNTVNTIMQDDEGNLWAGFRFSGIARLDKGKKHWNTYDSGNGLPNGTVTNLFQDSRKRIWIATLGGVAIIENGQITPFPLNDQFPHPIIYNILEDNQGHIWFKPSRGGVAKWDGEALSVYGKEEGLPNDVVRDMYMDADGRIWFITTTGIGMYDGEISLLNRESGLSSDFITTVHSSRKGLVWIGSRYGLNRFQDQPLETMIEDRQREVVPYWSNSRSILEDGKNRLWFPSYAGLGFLEGQSFRLFTRDDGLPSNVVHLVIEDTDEQMWAACDLGIAVSQRDTFVPLGLDQDIRPFRLRSGKDGGVWILDHAGRAWFATKNDGRPPELEYRGTFDGAENLVVLKNGQVWLRTAKQMIQIHPAEDEKQSFFLPEQKIFGMIWHRDEWWMGGYQGLHTWRNGTFSNDPTLGLEEPQTIAGFYFGPENEIWIKRSSQDRTDFTPDSIGLSRFDGDKFHHYHPGRELLGPNIGRVVAPYDGPEAWILHDRGLTTFHRERNSFEHFTVAKGLSGNQPREVLRSSEGHLWIGTNGGITKVHRDKPFITKLSREDGLLDDVVTDIKLDPSGHLWIRTQHGLQLYRGEPVGPIVKLLGWRNDETDLPLTSGIALPSHQNNLTFHIEAIYLQRGAGRIRYDYELSSKDTVATGVTSEPRIHLPGLRPGIYRLKVNAFNPDFEGSSEPVDFLFTIEAPLWLRPWFLIAAALLLALLVYLIYRYRLGGKLEKARVLNELQTAQRMQMSLMPVAPPKQDQVLLHGLCIPAKEVGGDFYDYFWMDKQKKLIGVTVMDVSGKSMEAAIISVMNSGLICGEQGSGRSPGQLLSKINHPLYLKTNRKTFTTALFGVIDLDTLIFTWANAGHSDPVILRNGKLLTWEKPPRADLPLGAVPDWEYQEQDLALEPGDTLLLYTDGLDETHNMEQDIFGKERIEEILLENYGSSPEKLVQQLLLEIDQFRGEAEQHDDITMIALQVKVRREEDYPEKNQPTISSTLI